MILIVAGGRSYRLTLGDLARLDDLAQRLPIRPSRPGRHFLNRRKNPL